MKQEVGLGAVIALAVAAAVGVNSFRSGSPGEGRDGGAAGIGTAPHRVKPKRGADESFSRGPCVEIEDHLKRFLGVSDPDVIAAPITCLVTPAAEPGIQPPSWDPKQVAQQLERQAAELRTSAAQVKFAIATLPDPVHSHFALQFDRMTEAIQQAASDEEYVFEAAWFPWEATETAYARIGDQDVADDRKGDREEQPGIMLFRKSAGYGLQRVTARDVVQKGDNGALLPNPPTSKTCPTNEKLPYCEGLVIFVVGEEPTQGIHREQFRNAASWIAALEGSSGYALPGIILSPSFSGSVPALAGLIAELQNNPFSPHKPRIYSGNISGQHAMDWMNRAIEGRAEFASFQRSDDFLLNRYCDLMKAYSFDLARLAILSEDQTAYGSEVRSAPPATGKTDPQAEDGLDGCDSAGNQPPLRLYYPRDISGLRAAYQKQSLFISNTTAEGQTGGRTLAPDIVDPESDQHDTIRVYGGDQTTLSQEAVMQQIVSEMRVHQSEYILVRSSNVLDQLFLSHYLRLRYPQGRVVILGADQLLHQESGRTRLSGIMTLTTYPLLPWEPHWTKVVDQPRSHSHRVFAQDRAEGTYIAMRTLLHFPVMLQSGERCEDAIWKVLAAGYTIKGEDLGNHLHDRAKSLCREPSQGMVFLPPAAGDQPSNTITLDTTYAQGTQGLIIEIHNPAYDSGSGHPQNATDRTPQYLQLLTIALPPHLKGFAPIDSAVEIPDYRAPFWIDRDGLEPKTWEQPAVWLSVLGRDDFWPLAALNCTSVPGNSGGGARAGCEMISGSAQGGYHPGLPHALAGMLPFTDRRSDAAMQMHENSLVPMPLSTRLVLVAIVLWAVFHCCCCVLPSAITKPSYRAYFVCCSKHCRAYLVLQVLAGLSIVAAATVVGWGFGMMAPDLTPILHPKLWDLVLLLIWTLVGTGLAVNVWRQLDPFPDRSAGRFHLFSRIREEWPAKRRKMLVPVAWFAAGSVAVYLAVYASMEQPQLVATRFATYWRSMNLGNGVSPEAPVLALCVGLYLWAWYSLQGVALMGQTKPFLPPNQDLKIDLPCRSEDPADSDRAVLGMFSEKGAGEPIADLCEPFTPRFRLLAALLFTILLGLALLVRSERSFSWSTWDAPIRSLGARAYAIMICLVIIAFLTLMLAKAGQLLWIWRELRTLLVHLDRLPLRRSMRALPRRSWGSVWHMSGSVFEMRYELLTAELRALSHLKNNWKDPTAAMQVEFGELEQEKCRFTAWYADVWDSKTWFGKQLDFLFGRSSGHIGSMWEVRLWDDQKAFDQTRLSDLQKRLARLAALLMVRLLVPEWQAERGELLEGESSVKEKKNKKENKDLPAQGENLPLHLAHAEQFVCSVYLGFIQNVLGRMRSMVLGILWLFIAATMAMSSYPFDPRPLIGGVLLATFVALSMVVTVVYAQMHRDATLSLVTNTEPGELGADFWLKIIGFGTGPVLALLTTIFPDIAEFAFSWLQPGLDATK